MKAQQSHATVFNPTQAVNIASFYDYEVPSLREALCFRA
jgi:hypothetical protein